MNKQSLSSSGPAHSA